MRTTKIKTGIVLALAVAGCVWAMEHKSQRTDAPRAVSVQPAIVAAAQAPAPMEPAPEAVPELPPAPKPSKTTTANPPAPVPAPLAKAAKAKKTPAAPRQKEAIQDPTAREALGYVGLDPLAEQYWIMAINDPSLPSEERKDLIEDLNEDGFADPKHLGPDDLPLIENRLALIESLAPDAMDPINYAAFQEAYKDLANMLVKAQ